MGHITALCEFVVAQSASAGGLCLIAFASTQSSPSLRSCYLRYKVLAATTSFLHVCHHVELSILSATRFMRLNKRKTPEKAFEGVPFAPFRREMQQSW